MPGKSRDRLPKPLPPERVLDVGVGVARGLAAAHRSGVVHRDVKPANVVVLEDGTPKLLDLGLARLLAGRGDEPAGTPDDRAPEIWTGDPGGARADVCSLGALLYELCAGTPPSSSRRSTGRRRRRWRGAWCASSRSSRRAGR